MKRLKTKDVVMVALLSALYMIFYFVAMMAVTLVGAVGHAISPGICGLITGSIFYFMSRKIGKFGQFTIMQAIVMLLFSIMGAGYIPWFITSMIAAVIADFVASRENSPSVWKVALASGIFHVGHALGEMIPTWFFLESYKAEFVARGQTPEAMDEMIKYTEGTMGVLATVVVFVLSLIGVYLGQLILKKHLDKKNVAVA